MAGKKMESTIQHEIHIKFGDAPVVEFHNVSVIEMMACVKMLDREVERALMQIEIERMQMSQNGLQPFAAIPGGMKEPRS